MALRRHRVGGHRHSALRVLVPLEARRGEAGRGRRLRRDRRAARHFIFNWLELLYLIVPLFIVAALVAEMLRGAPFDKMILSVGSTVLGVLYVALLGGHMIAIRTGFEPRHVPETYLVGAAYVSKTLSTHLLSFFFLVLMGSDTGAYYTGRLLGKHKLAPSVSPGKTWEGAFGGMAASLLAAALAHYWFFPELALERGAAARGRDERARRRRRPDRERAQARREREGRRADSPRPRRPPRPAR
jgi:dolichol kinase